MPSVSDVIVHCQKQIKKEPPEAKLLHYLSRLDRLRVTTQDLMDTGVGRTVNQLSRHDGDVGKFATRLVTKWKEMVSEENSDSEDSQSSSSEEEEDEEIERKINGNVSNRIKLEQFDGLESDEEADGMCIDDLKQPIIERYEEPEEEELKVVKKERFDSDDDTKEKEYQRRSNSKKHKDKSRFKYSKQKDGEKEKCNTGSDKKEHKRHSSPHKHKVKEEVEDHERKRKKHELKNETNAVASTKQIISSPDRKRMKLQDKGKSSDESSKLKKKPSIHIEEEINSTSGVKFEELLGCLDNSLEKIRDGSRDKTRDKNKKTKTDDGTNPEKRSEAKKGEEKKRKKHVSSIIAPVMNISPYYKPPVIAAATSSSTATLSRPTKSINLNTLEGCDPGNYWEDNRIPGSSKESNAEDALSSMMASRNQRTKVFSGRTIGCKGFVPRLFDLCMQVIQDNIGDLGYTGGVPYEILKPAIERANAQQLLLIEEYNPYLLDSTDELWQFHANREFKGKTRQEMETWRELYERCTAERDQKFAIVKNQMLKKFEVAAPVRKAKLAYVEPVGGPRFNRQKAATIKNGMKSLKIKDEKGPKKGVGTSASVGFNNPTESSKIVEEHAVIINPDSRAGGSSGSRAEPVTKCKPRRAPLMAKTMKFIKTLKRR